MTDAHTPREFAVRLFGGEAPVGEDARVRIGDSALVIETARDTHTWPLDQLRQTRGQIRGEPVHLERHGSDAVIVCNDPAIVTALLVVRPDLAGRVKKPGHSFGARVAVITVIGAAVAFAMFKFGVPAFAGFVAGHVPIEWEKRFGEMVVAQMEPQLGKPIEDPRVVEPVARVVERMRAADAGSPYAYRVIVVPRPEVNAMAAPGGTIIVFAGLLRLADAPEELAAVLAHEIEHISARHTLKAMLADASLGFLIEAMFGSGSSSVAGVAKSLGQLSYSRAAETEADDGGVRRLRAARLDPRAMPNFLERMAAQEGHMALAGFLSTHPDPKDRAERLRSAIGAGEPAEREVIVSAEEWQEMRAALQVTRR